MRHGINHRDVSVDLHGLPIENRWLVMPLAYRVERGLIKHEIAPDNFKRLNGTIGRNDASQFHATFLVNLLWQGWIDGLDATNQHRWIDGGHSNDAVSRRWLNNWLRRPRTTACAANVYAPTALWTTRPFNSSRADVRWASGILFPVC